jgi:hypothetical protein
MRIAISGSSGLVGTALAEALRTSGHDVLRLVRRPTEAKDELSWDPAAGVLDTTGLDGVEAVINLAGAGLGDHRWTRSYKRLVYQSRIQATTTLATALAGMREPPRVLVSGSAIGIYGADHGRDILDEDTPVGQDFLADLCRDWEAATTPARDAGIAVCHPRLGIVMDRRGGALARLLPFFRLGVGGPLADGEQFWSYVSLDDTVRALQFLVEQHGCVGPYNVTAPQPVSNAEFSRVLAQALRRPAMLRPPEFGIRAVLGEYSEVVLGSLRVLPLRLLDTGFVYQHPDARSVVDAALD